jgi:hypothetical protein
VNACRIPTVPTIPPAEQRERDKARLRDIQRRASWIAYQATVALGELRDGVPYQNRLTQVLSAGHELARGGNPPSSACVVCLREEEEEEGVAAAQRPTSSS